jgi:hypothetical protein
VGACGNKLRLKCLLRLSDFYERRKYNFTKIPAAVCYVRRHRNGRTDGDSEFSRRWEVMRAQAPNQRQSAQEHGHN